MCLDCNKNMIVSSCVNKTLVFIPETVVIKIWDQTLSVSGNLGVLTHVLPQSLHIQYDNVNCVAIYATMMNKKNKSLIGTNCSLIHNMIVGVTQGYVKKLQLVGIGYRAVISQNILNLTVGLSHTIDYLLPVGITAVCLNQTEIILSGIDKQLVGQVAANLRAIRPPDPFKGKGIRYSDEIVYSKNTKKR